MGCSPWNSLDQNTGVGSLSLLQGIFPTQGSNPHFLNYRRVLYQLSHKGTAIGTNKKFLKMKLWNQNRYDFDYFKIALAVWWSNGTSLQYSCLENPMDGGAWWAAVHGVTKSQTELNDFPFTFHFHALEKEMATHSSVLAWRIPGTGEPGGLPSLGSHTVGRDWSDLAVAVWWMLNTLA